MSDLRRRRSSRLPQLLAFDCEMLATVGGRFSTSFAGIIGVDEVGRGSLIGPVVAAALAFPPSEFDTETLQALQDLDDSKAAHFNHPKRLALAQILRKTGFWGIGEASREEVESLNVAQASLLASYRAVMRLGEQFPQCAPEQYLVLIDGKSVIRGLPFRQIPQVKADAKSAAVAAASILAKAYRDEMIIRYAQDYPGYGWEKNAGYPTPEHQQAIETLGITPLHRKSYKIIREMQERQQTLMMIAPQS